MNQLAQVWPILLSQPYPNQSCTNRIYKSQAGAHFPHSRKKNGSNISFLYDWWCMRIISRLMIWDLVGEIKPWILPGFRNKEHIKWDFFVDADGSGKVKEGYLNTCLNIQSYTYILVRKWTSISLPLSDLEIGLCLWKFAFYPPIEFSFKTTGFLKRPSITLINISIPGLLPRWFRYK